MTDREICISYRDAKNKNMQIKILSELTLKSLGEIKNILVENGYKVPGMDVKPKKEAKPANAKEMKSLEALATVEKIVIDDLNRLDADIELIEADLKDKQYKRNLLQQFLADYCG